MSEAEHPSLMMRWQQILSCADGILPPEAITKWISRITPISLQDQQLTLAVADVFTKEYIEPRYLVLLGDAVRQSLGDAYSIRLVVDSALAARVQAAVPASGEEDAAPEPAVPAQETLPLAGAGGMQEESLAAAPDDTTSLNPKYTFEAFVTGRSNQFPYAMAKAVADAPGLPSHNPLFIYGGVGLGKTHLMHAVGHKILADHPEKRVLYIPSTDFTNEFIRSIREKNMDAFRQKYYSIDVLLIDDIQFFAGQEQTQTEFFQTFNKLRDNGSQIILTSDRQPQDVKGLEDRLISRFAGGAPVDIQPPEFETRVAILQKKAQTEEVQIPEEVVVYIASRVDSNIRELEGALTRLIKYASTMRLPIDETTCIAALGNYLRGEKGRRITMEMIERIVCTHFKVSSEDIRSVKRSNDIAYPRQIAMYLCHELTDVSWPTIGGFFNRDHSTVMHAHKKIQGLIKKDAAAEALLQSLTVQIRGI